MIAKSFMHMYQRMAQNSNENDDYCLEHKGAFDENCAKCQDTKK